MLTPFTHLLSLFYTKINAGSIGPEDPWSSVMALMPDPDITGHHGDKNTQTDGRVHRQGREAAITTKDFRGEENYNYSCLLTSAYYVVSKCFSGCPFRDNSLPGRYKCKDNHTQSRVAVMKITPISHQFQYYYLTRVWVTPKHCQRKNYRPVIKALQVATHLKQRKEVKEKVNVKRKWLSTHWLH